MTREAREKIRREAGMRRLLDLRAQAVDVVSGKAGGIIEEKGVLVMEDGTRLPYRMRRREGELPSVRPVLVLPEGLDAEDAEVRVRRYLYAWRTVMEASPRKDDGTPQALARRAEDALALARLLSHRNAGKTVEVYAFGKAVAPAALMMAVERPYFSVLTAENPPPSRKGWPAWEEMAK